MIVNLTCPKCGNEFEIEESHQAQEKQDVALKAQRKEAEKETQRLLAEQKKQLAKKQDSMVDAAVKKQVEEELNESRKRLLSLAEKETQRLLAEQKKQFAKEQDSIVEAAVKKQVEEKQAVALKATKVHLNQQLFVLEEKKDRERDAALTREKSQNKIKENRMLIQINELQARVKRDQGVELVGEAAEERLKEALRERFPDDKILDVPKGKQGADLEQHVNLKAGGQSIGMILIERKSTKVFSQTWIPKLKKDIENSGAITGVIVTDTMPKKHKDKGYYEESSKISVLRADTAVDGIEILRKGLITNYRLEVAEMASKDYELTTNVFTYITGKGREHLEDMKKTFEDKEKLLLIKEQDHNKIMKKEWKNLKNQVDAFNKLGDGLKEASKERFNLLNASTTITDQRIND